MSDSEDTAVTRRELALELRSLRNEMRLLILVAIVTSNFDVPESITASAVLAVVGKMIWSGLASRAA